MAKRPIATQGKPELEELPEFPAPQHPPLCNLIMSGGLEECDCGLADMRQIRPEQCGATSPWQTHCTHEVEHPGRGHSWQPTGTIAPGVLDDHEPDMALVVHGAIEPLPGSADWDSRPAIRQVDGKWTAIELAGMPAKEPKGTRRMNAPTDPIVMTATLKRAASKSGTQADPDSYLEMVLRSNDMDAFGELGRLTGKLVTLTIQPLQPRLPSFEGMAVDEPDIADDLMPDDFEGDEDRAALLSEQQSVDAEA